MNKRQTIFLPTAVAVILSLTGALTSCRKDDAPRCDTGVLTLTVGSMTPDTRATLHSGTLTAGLTEGIGIIGYNNTTYRFTDVANYSDSKWKTANAHEFTLQRLKYMAYYPYTCSAMTSVSSTESSLQFTYTVPTEASDQKDVMVGYNDNSGTGFLWLQDDVSITMSHALVGIKFIYGDDLGGVSDKTVDSLRISGVYASQSCTATFTTPSTVTFSWGTTSSSTTVKGKTTTDTPTTGTDLGVVFALIPQNFTSPATPPTLEAKLSDGSTVSCDFPTSTSWTQGYIYTYTLDFPITDVEMVISETDVTVADLDTGSSHDIKMK